MTKYIMPQKYDHKKIEDMRNGEVGWIVAWCIDLDCERRIYIDTGFHVEDEEWGTANVQIRMRNSFIEIDESTLKEGDHDFSMVRVGGNHMPAVLVDRIIGMIVGRVNWSVKRLLEGGDDD